ncbi:16S rRNA (guanine(966)-N(2))-methyltransferase RsmD [Candidatus Poriferisocius sp.]|uniref:16S rRNA (guanine(966)-N(2))-methyltransferase RsmD n=1 Tax=Candidatus Poriferisocius sp. TaxID=3101276 RepID=UPI003B02A5C3
MTLRIIAGEARGRRLSTPEGMEVRPTTSRVREAVFNSLHSQGRLAGADVLDLFAGSGALGLEAVSRGAASATFVESALPALAALRANIDAIGFNDRCRVVPGDVMEELPRLDGDYDVALCDPPYGFDDWPELLSRLPANVVMAESDQAVEPGPGWDVIKQRRYAGTVVVIASRR